MRQKVLCTYNGVEMHVTCERFENAASRTNDNIILTFEITFATVHVTDDDVRFCDGPVMVIRRTTSRVLTAREFPC